MLLSDTHPSMQGAFFTNHSGCSLVIFANKAPYISGYLSNDKTLSNRINPLFKTRLRTWVKSGMLDPLMCVSIHGPQGAKCQTVVQQAVKNWLSLKPQKKLSAVNVKTQAAAFSQTKPCHLAIVGKLLRNLPMPKWHGIYIRTHCSIRLQLHTKYTSQGCFVTSDNRKKLEDMIPKELKADLARYGAEV